MRLFEGEVLLWRWIGKEPWKWGPDVLGSIFPLNPDPGPYLTSWTSTRVELSTTQDTTREE